MTARISANASPLPDRPPPSPSLAADRSGGLDPAEVGAEVTVAVREPVAAGDREAPDGCGEEGSPEGAAVGASMADDRGCAPGLGVGDAPVCWPDVGWLVGDGARDGVGSTAGVGLGSGTHTSSIETPGGFACVLPVSPVPHTQPSSSPSPTVDEAAPIEDQVQAPEPSPLQ
jgi:hypothetical protein